MRFECPLLPGRLLRRYQRFFADVELDSGGRVTAHSPNTGAMLGCSRPGARVWLRDAAHPKRKLRYTWEVAESDCGTLVGVNPARANDLVAEAIGNGLIGELQGYGSLRREVPDGAGSRLDLLLEAPRRPRCFVEVKSVTARIGRWAVFPDAVTQRGRKHLTALAARVEAGERAVLCFCVQRGDVEALRAAAEIDPDYAVALQEAVLRGVEVLAYRAEVGLEGIALAHRLSFHLRPGESGASLSNRFMF